MVHNDGLPTPVRDIALDSAFDGKFDLNGNGGCDSNCFWVLQDTSLSKYRITELWSNIDLDPASVLNSTIPNFGFVEWTCLTVEKSEKPWRRNRVITKTDFGGSFDYVKCGELASEVFKKTERPSNIWLDLARSPAFWSIALVFVLLLYVFGVRFIYRHFKKYKNQSLDKDTGKINNSIARKHAKRDILEEDKNKGVELLQIEDVPRKRSISYEEVTVQVEDENAVKRKRCNCPRRSPYQCMPCYFIFILGMFFWLLVCMVSLLESCGVAIYFPLAILTPACSARNVCPNAKTYFREHDSSKVDSERNKKFSFIISSDSQLDWFNGEHRELGSFPSACTKGDSYEQCKSAISEQTNKEQIAAYDDLITRPKSENYVPPDTLVVNGDLTAYFHPSEFWRFEGFHHTLVEKRNLQFYPGLGNHDYTLNIKTPPEIGARYFLDMWLGQPDPGCNADHALAYMRDGLFCGKSIPGLDKDALRSVDAGSLAYSFDRGNFHFVQLHYHTKYTIPHLDLKGSLEWLERDLEIAHNAGLASVLWVHAFFFEYRNQEFRRLVDLYNVVAIFAGHKHKCVGNKCAFVSLSSKNGIGTKKCFKSFAQYFSNGYSGGSSWYFDDGTYLDDDEFTNNEGLTTKKIKAYCAPYDTGVSKLGNASIFWSGSYSFQTFLHATFLPKTIHVEAYSSLGGKAEELKKQIHTLYGKRVYPFHNENDLSYTIHLD